MAASLLVVVLGLIGCGTVESIADPGSDIPTTRKADSFPEVLAGPPPVTLHYGDDSVDLVAYTFCFRNGCADGAPPTNPPDVGSPDTVSFDFPLDGWSFEASFTPTGERCGRAQTVPAQATDQGSFVLAPAGYAGTYDVTLFGRGGGDLFTVFRWSTPSAGPLPAPEARLAVLADNDGEVDNYGVELALSNLAETPREATAAITVTAANGKASTFAATRPTDDCQPTGSVYWDGPDAEGLAAAQLGPRPFTYHVVLTLDGIRHAATARWPRDVIEGNEPSVGLTFRPALPALRPR